MYRLALSLMCAVFLFTEVVARNRSVVNDAFQFLFDVSNPTFAFLDFQQYSNHGKHFVASTNPRFMRYGPSQQVTECSPIIFHNFTGAAHSGTPAVVLVDEGELVYQLGEAYLGDPTCYSDVLILALPLMEPHCHGEKRNSTCAAHTFAENLEQFFRNSQRNTRVELLDLNTLWLWPANTSTVQTDSILFVQRSGAELRRYSHSNDSVETLFLHSIQLFQLLESMVHEGLNSLPCWTNCWERSLENQLISHMFSDNPNVREVIIYPSSIPECQLCPESVVVDLPLGPISKVASAWVDFVAPLLPASDVGQKVCIQGIPGALSALTEALQARFREKGFFSVVEECQRIPPTVWPALASQYLSQVADRLPLRIVQDFRWGFIQFMWDHGNLVSGDGYLNLSGRGTSLNSGSNLTLASGFQFTEEEIDHRAHSSLFTLADGTNREESLFVRDYLSPGTDGLWTIVVGWEQTAFKFWTVGREQPHNALLNRYLSVNYGTGSLIETLAAHIVDQVGGSAATNCSTDEIFRHAWEGLGTLAATSRNKFRIHLPKCFQEPVYTLSRETFNLLLLRFVQSTMAPALPALATSGQELCFFYSVGWQSETLHILYEAWVSKAGKRLSPVISSPYKDIEVWFSPFQVIHTPNQKSDNTITGKLKREEVLEPSPGPEDTGDSNSPDSTGDDSDNDAGKQQLGEDIDATNDGKKAGDEEQGSRVEARENNTEPSTSSDVDENGNGDDEVDSVDKTPPPSSGDDVLEPSPGPEDTGDSNSPDSTGDDSDNDADKQQLGEDIDATNDDKKAGDEEQGSRVEARGNNTEPSTSSDVDENGNGDDEVDSVDETPPPSSGDDVLEPSPGPEDTGDSNSPDSTGDDSDNDADKQQLGEDIDATNDDKKAGDEEQGSRVEARENNTEPSTSSDVDENGNGDGEVDSVDETPPPSSGDDVLEPSPGPEDTGDSNSPDSTGDDSDNDADKQQLGEDIDATNDDKKAGDEEQGSRVEARGNNTEPSTSSDVDENGNGDDEVDSVDKTPPPSSGDDVLEPSPGPEDTGDSNSPDSTGDDSDNDADKQQLGEDIDATNDDKKAGDEEQGSRVEARGNNTEPSTSSDVDENGNGDDEVDSVDETPPPSSGDDVLEPSPGPEDTGDSNSPDSTGDDSDNDADKQQLGEDIDATNDDKKAGDEEQGSRVEARENNTEPSTSSDVDENGNGDGEVDSVDETPPPSSGDDVLEPSPGPEDTGDSNSPDSTGDDSDNDADKQQLGEDIDATNDDKKAGDEEQGSRVEARGNNTEPSTSSDVDENGNGDDEVDSVDKTPPPSSGDDVLEPSPGPEDTGDSNSPDSTGDDSDNDADKQQLGEDIDATNDDKKAGDEEQGSRVEARGNNTEPSTSSDVDENGNEEEEVDQGQQTMVPDSESEVLTETLAEQLAHIDADTSVKLAPTDADHFGMDLQSVTSVGIQKPSISTTVASFAGADLTFQPEFSYYVGESSSLRNSDPQETAFQVGTLVEWPSKNLSLSFSCNSYWM